MTSLYTFGDSELARERLAIVADTFASCTRALLCDLPTREPRYVIDLGCGPGYTSAILEAVYPRAHVTGLDASAAMIADAATRGLAASFVVADVTTPLELPADVIYSRLLLGHLADQRAALSTWAAALRPPGLLICEEPVRYRSDDPWFARYESLVTAVVARRGGMLWAGPALDDDPAGCERVLDRVVEHPVRVGRAAAMFWRNAMTWGADDPEALELVARFRSVEADDPPDDLIWEMRQTVWAKRDVATSRG